MERYECSVLSVHVDATNLDLFAKKRFDKKTTFFTKQ